MKEGEGVYVMYQ